MLRITVLGPLAATGDNAVHVTVDDLPRRARQVLGVLAARHDRIQSKDALADAVWGEDLPANHHAALEHYVSTLRRRLEPGVPTSGSFIVTRAGGYLLSSARAELDLAELRRLVRLADAERAGSPERLRPRQQILDLAADLPFPEDEYAEWAEPVRGEVRGVLVDALLEVAEDAVGKDPDRAARLAARAVELDGYLERGYQIAMRASVRAGRADDGLRWYYRCVRVLDEELGVAPSPRTVQLHREILVARTGPELSGDLGLPHRSQPEQESTIAGEHVPFLGRDAEIELLSRPAALSVLHIVGPAGAGKSALLAEAARRAPGRVGIGQGPGSAGALRLNWLRTVLGQLGAAPDALAVVDRAMAAGRGLTYPDLEVVASVLDRPVVVAIDDADGLDADSVNELSWLRQRCPALTIVLTYRYPSALVGAPVAALDAGMVLRLTPLTEEDLEPAGRPELIERTGGIPALVAAAYGRPELAAPVAMHLARLRTRWMPPLAWEVLRLTATLGSLRVEQLARLTGAALTEVLGCVDHLTHAHLVVEGPGGHVRHRGGLVREAIAEQVSSAHGTHLRDQLGRDQLGRDQLGRDQHNLPLGA